MKPVSQMSFIAQQFNGLFPRIFMVVFIKANRFMIL